MTGAAETIARLREQLADAREQLASIHEGEQPYTDDAILPTPAQWIWQWNRATPARRLDVVTSIQTLSDQTDRVHALTWRWAQAEPLVPGQALAELRHALAGDPEPAACQNVQVGDRTIRFPGGRVPTPDEQKLLAVIAEAAHLYAELQEGAQPAEAEATS